MEGLTTIKNKQGVYSKDCCNHLCSSLCCFFCQAFPLPLEETVDVDELFHGDILAAFPQAVDIAVTDSVDFTGSMQFYPGNADGFRKGACLSVCLKVEGCQFHREFPILFHIKYLDPADMMFQGVGMLDGIPDGGLQFKSFVRFYFIGNVNDGYVFFSLPVSGLQVFSYRHAKLLLY
jgi:hypothetical protein